MTEAMTISQIEEQKIDEQIQQYEATLAELKKAKEIALKKEEGFAMYTNYLDTLNNDYNITEEELFARRSVQVGDWITTTLSRHTNSALMKRLEKFFSEREKAQSRKKPGQNRARPAKALPPGVYRHPMSLETVEKKTRAPKELNTWVLENGMDKVLTWRLED